MERFFRSLKTEWIPITGYQSFNQAKTNIINYIIGYYSQVRPHQHNNGFAPNVTEKNYWAEYKTVANYLITTIIWIYGKVIGRARVNN